MYNYVFCGSLIIIIEPIPTTKLPLHLSQCIPIAGRTWLTDQVELDNCMHACMWHMHVIGDVSIFSNSWSGDWKGQIWLLCTQT